MRVTLAAWRRLASFWEGAAQLRRWSAFSLVGVLGILIQLSTLAALTGGLGLPYLLGTGLAVEAAVLHNFIWHEHWTWSDREGLNKEGMGKRLVRFHLANGVISLGGNLILMRLLVGSWSMNYAVANGVSITICSFLNFLASDRFVFQGTLRKTATHGFAFRMRRRLSGILGRTGLRKGMEVIPLQSACGTRSSQRRSAEASWPFRPGLAGPSAATKAATGQAGPPR